VYTALVYSVTGQHVTDTMVNGRWLYRKNKWLTVDHDKARVELETQHDRLMKKVKK
jgi:type II secretory pathway component PulL